MASPDGLPPENTSEDLVSAGFDLQPARLLDAIISETEMVLEARDAQEGISGEELQRFRAFVAEHSELDSEQGIRELVRFAMPAWVRSWVPTEANWQALVAEIASSIQANPESQQRLRRVWQRLLE